MKDKKSIFNILSLSSLYIPHGSDESGIERVWGNSKSSFISHMVQMKANTSNKRKCTNDTTLYPTWFRWKARTIARTLTLTPLYIPHGSDESFLSLDVKSSESELYIPHGSDESVLWATASWYSCYSFISHMVQMKGFSGNVFKKDDT